MPKKHGGRFGPRKNLIVHNPAVFFRRIFFAFVIICYLIISISKVRFTASNPMNRIITGDFLMEKLDNIKLLKALDTIKTYCAPTLLDELDYTIKIIEKLERDGIKDPLETDFTKLRSTEDK